MSYKPLPDNLTIKESPIHGLGVFATEDISTETIIPCCSHLIIDEPHLAKELQRLNFGGFINHSKNPNCTLKMVVEFSNNNRKRSYYKLETLKEINIGEEITLNYTKELCGLTDYEEEEWLK